jgi:hypothetical protein
MKMFRSILFALATFAAVPALALASQTQGTPQKSPAAAPKPAVRAVAGVVKSVDANSLVITTVATGKEKAQDLTFVLNGTTERKGTIAAGARVSIRYQVESGKNVASAVTVQEKGKGR